MVLWQFPIHDPRDDMYDNTAHTRIMSSVYHNWSGRKVRVKLTGLHYFTDRAGVGWVGEMMRIDFLGLVAFERPAIESGSTNLGGSSSQGFIFSNLPGSYSAAASTVYPIVNQGSADYYFDCILQGPIVTIDILPFLYQPGARDVAGTTPFDYFTVPFLHALISLDVTLLD